MLQLTPYSNGGAQIQIDGKGKKYDALNREEVHMAVDHFIGGHPGSTNCPLCIDELLRDREHLTSEMLVEELVRRIETAKPENKPLIQVDCDHLLMIARQRLIR